MEWKTRATKSGLCNLCGTCALKVKAEILTGFNEYNDGTIPCQRCGAKTGVGICKLTKDSTTKGDINVKEVENA